MFVPDQPTRGRFVPDEPPEPVAVQAGRGLMEIPRQVGLAARYAVEGPAQVADLLTEPVRNLVMNPILRAFGAPQIEGSTSQAATRLADAVGLPSPENANERVVGDASRSVAGAGVPIGLAGKGTSALAKSLAQAPGAQAASAAGAGLAGGSVREAGGGPGEQFVASLAGGLAAPAALRLGQNAAQSATTAARKVFAPRDIEATLKAEFDRAGMDWAGLSRKVQMDLAKEAEAAIYSGQPLNTAALRRLADFRNVEAIPTMGAVTQNPALVTQERNLAKQLANTTQPTGAVNLPMVENANTQRVLQTLEGMADSPLDTYATGKAISERVVSTNAAKDAVKRGLYNEARDSSGRAIPLDRDGFVNQAFDNLAQNNRGPWLPDQVRQVLNTLSKGGGEFTVDTIDQLKTLLAQESRATANGNTRAALSAVRDALENVQPAPLHRATGSTAPVTGQMAAGLRAVDAATPRMSQESLDAFNRARAFARSQFEWQKSAPFIEDALEGIPPDKFVDKHVLRAAVEDLDKLAKFSANDPEIRNAVRKQLLEFIVRKGSGDSDIVKIGSSKAMKDALDAIGDRKLALFFDPKEVGQIKSAVNVARYIQAQPAGSAVNNSNTGAMVWGRLSDLLLKGERVPVLGPLAAKPLRGFTMNMQGREAFNTADALMIARQRQKMPVTPLLLAAGVPRGDQ